MQYASTRKAIRNYKMEAAYRVYLDFRFVAIAEEIFELGSEVVVQKQIKNMRTPCVINVVCKSKITIWRLCATSILYPICYRPIRDLQLSN
jgi:hypothetical protein